MNRKISAPRLLAACFLWSCFCVASTVRADWDWTPIQLSLAAPAQLVPQDWDVYGLRLGVIYSENRNVGGIDIGMFNCTTKHGSGFGLGVLWNDVNGEFKGIQVSGICNSVYGDNLGVQIAGVVNKMGDDSLFKGIQIGVVNLAADMDGVQLGLLNCGVKNQGLQIGVINVTETLAGIQIGLVNVNAAGPLLWCPILNVGF